MNTEIVEVIAQVLAKQAADVFRAEMAAAEWKQKAEAVENAELQIQAANERASLYAKWGEELREAVGHDPTNDGSSLVNYIKEMRKREREEMRRLCLKEMNALSLADGVDSASIEMAAIRIRAIP